MLFFQWWYLPILVAALVVYWRGAAPGARLHWLTAVSLLILTLASWRSTLGFLVLAGVTYTLSKPLRRKSGPPRVRTIYLTIGIGANVAYLATFKYAPAYVPPAAVLLSAVAEDSLLLPLGISYFTFRFLHYLIEARRGTLPDHGWPEFLCYASLFSIFPAGPIERFGHLAPQLRAPAYEHGHLSEGVARILLGSIKKIVVADLVVVTLLGGLGRVSTEFETYSWRSQFAWLWGRLLYTYFDFSGYTDLAVGTTRLFGLRVVENFNRPLLRGNVSDFWRSWHMSLTSWCRDYVYFPVFGLTRSPKLAVYASMLVLGAWHGTHLGWVVWGAWQATGLAIWQVWQVRKRRWPALKGLTSSRAYGLVAWALTLNWIVLGGAWTMFDDLRTSARYLVEILLLR